MKRRGRPPYPDILTPREWQVLVLLREGLSNDAIADRLGVSMETAKSHVSAILMKLDVESRHEAAQWRPEPVSQRPWFGALVPAELLAKLKLHMIGYVAAAAIIGSAAIVLGLLAWGIMRSSSGGGTATTGGADPKLIIFTTLAQGTTTGQHERWTVNVYDTTAGRTVHSFDIGDGVAESPAQVVAAGDKLVANLGNRIVRYDLDGSHPQELRRANETAGTEAAFAPRFIGIAASPDARYIALTEQTADLCPGQSATAQADPTPVLCRPYADVTAVTVITAATGGTVMSVPQSNAGFAGYAGQGAIITWRDDGQGFVVSGYTYSEAGGGLATVMLDGSVKTYTDGAAGLAPNGRYVNTGTSSLVCGLGGTAVQHEIVVRRLDDDATLTAISDPVLNLTPQEWSPDGSALLYKTATLVPSPTDPTCVDEDQASARWYLLRTDRSSPVSVPDVFAVRREWFGARTVEFRCNGMPILNSYSCLAPNGWDTAVGAYVGDKLIGSGLEWHTVQLIPATDAPGPVN